MTDCGPGHAHIPPDSAPELAVSGRLVRLPTSLLKAVNKIPLEGFLATGGSIPSGRPVKAILALPSEYRDTVSMGMIKYH